LPGRHRSRRQHPAAVFPGRRTCHAGVMASPPHAMCQLSDGCVLRSHPHPPFGTVA
jgi:hypothetical protein